MLNTTSDNSETLPKNSAALESAIPTSESALPNNNAEQGNKQEEDTEGTEEDTESTGEPEETEVKEQANPMISYILMGGLAVAVIGAANSVPRIRGDDPRYEVDATIPAGVFPAYAGMIPARSATRRHSKGVPRIRGDDPAGVDAVGTIVACSPHTRG